LIRFHLSSIAAVCDYTEKYLACVWWNTLAEVDG
jgi:hypothetical protein